MSLSRPLPLELCNVSPLKFLKDEKRGFSEAEQYTAWEKGKRYTHQNSKKRGKLWIGRTLNIDDDE